MLALDKVSRKEFDHHLDRKMADRELSPILARCSPLTMNGNRKRR